MKASGAYFGIPCEPCAFEVFVLRQESHFPQENIDMYEQRYGIIDGVVRTWSQASQRFGYRPSTATEIGDNMQEWLDEHSPYRTRVTRAQGGLHPASRQCPLNE